MPAEPALVRADVQLHAGSHGVRARDWPGGAVGGLNADRGYLLFREHVEPGDPVLAVARDGERPLAGLHGVLTTAQTAMFSHPWKLLSSSQFLRLPGSGPGDPAAEALIARHAELVAGAAGGAADGPGWAAMSGRLGEALVVRGFDTSAALLRDGLRGDAAQALIAALLGALQRSVRDGAAGAIALPFVRPGDGPLRQALREAGFRRGVLTATTAFDLTAAASFEEFVAALPKRRRRKFLSDQAEFDSSGMMIRTVAMTDHLERLVELEAQNAEKYGGSPDRARLARVRAEMARLLGPAVRVPVAERDGTIIACGIDLVDADCYYGLVYGCDYAVPGRGPAYACLSFNDPIRFAASRGLRQVRLGFEAFAPKLNRGAVLAPRETWIWLPDPQALADVARLLAYLSDRNHGYLAALAGGTPRSRA